MNTTTTTILVNVIRCFYRSDIICNQYEEIHLLLLPVVCLEFLVFMK